MPILRAGIYGVEVLARYRRKGVGTALVYAAMEHGKKLGFAAAVLSATGKGEGVYKRLGFREVCKMSFWKYGKLRQLELNPFSCHFCVKARGIRGHILTLPPECARPRAQQR